MAKDLMEINIDPAQPGADITVINGVVMPPAVAEDTAEAKERERLESAITPFAKFNTVPVISTDEDFTAVADDLKTIKTLQADNASIFERVIKKYYEPYKFWLGVKNVIAKKLEALEANAKLGMKKRIDYLESERVRLQREVDDKARKDREAEQKKIDAQIARAEASGKTAKVEELQEKRETVAAAIPTPVINTAPPKVAGIATTKVWKGVVENFKLLPDDYKKADQSMIDKVGQSTKGKVVIPGVRWVEDTQIAAGKNR